MLRKLTVENFYSIREAQTLDLTIGRKATDPDGRFVETIPGSGKRFPKVVVLFGANASGKTNVLRALAFLQAFVRDSATKPVDHQLDFMPFLHDDTVNAPTRFRVEIDSITGEDGQVLVFDYEVLLNRSENRVLAERLKYTPANRQRLLFDRRDLDIKTGSDFDLPKRDPLRHKLRPNASAISTFAQFNHAWSVAIHQALQGIVSNINVMGKSDLTVSDASKFYDVTPEALQSLNAAVPRYDLGVLNVELAHGSHGLTARFHHEGLSAPLDIAFQSHGTRRLYSEFPRIYFALRSGGIGVFDELDNDIHPLVLPEIIRLFQATEDNPNNAQLIMSCHDVSLLEHLAKEEIYFTEKDREGQTAIYGLQDIRGVRRDENVYTNYLAGAYGAVPRLG